MTIILVTKIYHFKENSKKNPKRLMMLCNDRKIDTVVIGLILKPVLMTLGAIMHLSDTTHFLLSVVMEGKLA